VRLLKFDCPGDQWQPCLRQTPISRQHFGNLTIDLFLRRQFPSYESDGPYQCTNLPLQLLLHYCTLNIAPSILRLQYCTFTIAPSPLHLQYFAFHYYAFTSATTTLSSAAANPHGSSQSSWQQPILIAAAKPFISGQNIF
jgi:hypothetical protein